MWKEKTKVKQNSIHQLEQKIQDDSNALKEQLSILDRDMKQKLAEKEKEREALAKQKDSQISRMKDELSVFKSEREDLLNKLT